MATPLDLAAGFNGGTVTEAQQKVWIAALRAALAEMGDPMARYGAIQNLGFSMTVAGNALTIALKTRALADAGSEDPISATFRNVTPATGDFSILNVTAASSLPVSSGSSLGTRNGIPFRLWIVAFNDAGTWRPGVINCVTTAAGAGSGSDVTAIYPLSAWAIASSTAEGGAGAADSAQTFYTGTAVTDKAYVVLGYATWESGLATAGTWSSGPTRVQPFGPGVPLPGQVLQEIWVPNGGTTNATTTIPLDDTIPQVGEGTQIHSQAITPRSAANALNCEVLGYFGVNNTAEVVSYAMFVDGGANAVVAGTRISSASTSTPSPIPLRNRRLAAGTAAVTFSTRAGSSGGSTWTWNGGGAGVRIFGGVSGSYMRIAEIMG